MTVAIPSERLAIEEGREDRLASSTTAESRPADPIPGRAPGRGQKSCLLSRLGDSVEARRYEPGRCQPPNTSSTAHSRREEA
jgi:hypothetical protein